MKLYNIIIIGVAGAATAVILFILYKYMKETENTEDSGGQMDFIKIIKDNAKIFGGLYNEINDCAEGALKSSRMQNVLTEFKGRLKNIPQSKELLEKLDKMDDANKEALYISKLFEEADIKKGDDAGEIEVYNGLSQYYVELNSEELLVGDKVLVLKPYWKLNHIVLEKGIVKKLG